MMPNIEQAILVVSNSLAGSIIVKATIAVTLALVAAWFARRSRASIRHAVLAAGFAVLLALPIAAIFAPPIHIAVPMTQRPSATATETQQFSTVTTVATQAISNSGAVPAKSLASEISFLDILFAAWAVGAAFFLAPVVIGLWQVRSLRRTSLPWPRGNSIAATLGNETGVRRCVDVLLHESVAGPMTCGVMRPAILLSGESESWSEEDLSRAIAHELEHVRRGDWLTHCSARLACAVYWFHPFVWIAWRKLTLEAERACDDAVIARSEATAYAEQLVALARQLSAASRPPVLAMASRSDLSARVNSVLNTRQRRGRTGAIGVTLACVGALLLIVVLSPLRMIAAQQSSTEDWEKAAGGKMSFEVASIKLHPWDPASGGYMPRRNFPLGTDDTYTATGGLMSTENIPVLTYIAFAYKVMPGKIHSTLPKWANTEHFDIAARGPSSATKDQMRLMMQSLLADRFKLAVHWEDRQVPVFSVVLANAAKAGPLLQASPDEPCTASPHQGPPKTPSELSCGEGGMQSLPDGKYQVMGRHKTMQEIAPSLADWPGTGIDRPLVDGTGLAGTFDFKLVWVPEPRPGQQAQPQVSGPSYLDALRDQLGLKLVSSTGPSHYLVIDHIEEPTPN